MHRRLDAFVGCTLGCLFIIVSLSTPAHSATRRALLIGINEYAPPPGASPHVVAAEHAWDSRFAPGASWIDLKGPLTDVAEMQVLLTQTFGFEDVRLLEGQEASRQGIIAAIEKLAADTQPGDFDVVFYAGHGSRRLDTLSSKNHFDETIVPADAWTGTEDIRDKELSALFNKIVYGKHAHLTALFDSCNSGTMARGATASVARALAYDDRDVALEKRKNATTVVESDLKQIPQNGDAIIVAAAASDESAGEGLYMDGWHGNFSRALVSVLRSNTQAMSADDVVAAVSDIIHADNNVPFQQPSAEGRTQQSLFGEPIATHTLRIHVSRVSGSEVTLDLGSAAGFDAGTQFTALEANDDGDKTLIEVQHIDAPLISTAHIVSGPGNIKVGEVFELTKMTYPREARLVIFAPRPEPDMAAAYADAKQSFPRFTWVADPTVTAMDYLVVHTDQGWIAFDHSGHPVPSGAAAAGSAFALLGPPAAIRSALEQSAPYQHSGFTFTSDLAQAHYLLAARQRPDALEYTLLDPTELATHQPDAWIRSSENDKVDAALSADGQSEVVCRADSSLPVRTAWLRDTPDTRANLQLALTRRIVRLGKLRLWLKSQSLAPGAAGWPYRLTVMQNDRAISPGTRFHPNDTYQIKLVAAAGQRGANDTIPAYVYLFGFDCAGNPSLIYPKYNGDSKLPQRGPDNAYPLSIQLATETVSPPFGGDTLFLMAASEKLTHTQVLIEDGALDTVSREGVGRFEEMIADVSDTGTRSATAVPTRWLIQSFFLPSHP